MLKILAKEQLAKPDLPMMSLKPGVKLDGQMQLSADGEGRTVAEFVGTGDFATAWWERQRYEVDAGRDSEPILYTPIYPEISDPNLPRTVTVNRIGPAAVILEEILEGGEVKFMTIGSDSYTVPIKHYGVGLEYSKEMMMYNELWNVALAERQAGQALNALKNHIHLSPFINYSYTSANQTPADATSGATMIEKTLRTIEAGVTASKSDATNPRRGPYAILCAAANFFMLERALTAVPQQGFTQQSSVLGMIRALISYDGWTGTRGKKSVSYPGVTAGKAYLIDLGLRDRNFGTFTKQAVQRTTGNPDVSRFIIEQSVWDTYFGMYADVVASTEELTLPS